MEPLDERYFVWLYSLVADPTIQDRDLTYWELLRQLYERQFVWFVSRDDNRMEDGKQLRLEFLRSEGLRTSEVDRNWIDLGCSVLELMVAMSARLQFDLDPDSNLAYWFWEVLVENIGLRHCTDGEGFESCDVDETLNRVIFRQYEPDGKGGFFPLQHPEQDQRGVELWHQLSAYAIERMAQ
ncbi:hypothetical protein SEA_CLUBPENGUIN_62 [Streptomyces phage ClubPenguin]|nr:hypothetical protein SEA_CLUBPENGUIN_62 [Streptomyces phage ClubPenguin]